MGNSSTSSSQSQSNVATLPRRTFDDADQVQQFDKGNAQVISMGDHQFSRVHLDKDWRLTLQSADQSPSMGFVVRGVLHVKDSEGQAYNINNGEMYTITPGCEAWTDSPTEVIEIQHSGEPSTFYGSPTSSR